MERYDRQMKFNDFGENSQKKLMSATLMVMGAGALGTHVSEMLARMGAGKLIIIDMDIVEMTNLHRPARYTESDAEDMTLKDRKSTRLNSSHVSISYAVFCLRKKET